MSLKLIINTMFLCGFSFLSQNGMANKKLTENYISTYKNIAVSEMKRTGIPASIKLAQGILESDLGRSPLAFEANNHFGIKCGKDWTGDIYHKIDDETDENGSLIESCFRSYSSAEESYIAHSEFLTNPSKQGRYGFLFSLGSTDYEGWANGLKFSGYATDPTYPTKLIKIIESQKLYLYDEPTHAAKPNDMYATKNDGNTKKDSAPVLKTENMNNETNKKPSQKTSPSNYAKYSEINDLRMVYASGKESVLDIARRTGSNVFDLLEYNEELKSQDDIPEYEEIIFMEKKKKNISNIGPTHHIVNVDETMYFISQKYGIRLESLLAKNNLEPDAIPLKGESISLVKHLSKADTPKHTFIEKFDSFVDLGGLK